MVDLESVTLLIEAPRKRQDRPLIYEVSGSQTAPADSLSPQGNWLPRITESVRALRHRRSPQRTFHLGEEVRGRRSLAPY